MNKKSGVEIWGGIECTINRVGDQYFDQLEYAGHYKRGLADIDLVASLGVKMLRYPVLWEKHQPEQGQSIDWSFTEQSLCRMKELGITPIAGLVHHGSGPQYVNFFDGSFEHGLAEYATKVAQQFPWLEFFTPVNEPLTTARFCGLYGHWYPHGKNDYSFFKVLLSECKATVLAMKAICVIIPEAKLIQTEDLGKCHSTPLLQYQADLENERRWLSYELLCGTLTPDKVMYQYMLMRGIQQEELDWFLENNFPPHIAGFNYYLTSERYLDEEKEKYPPCFHGGNGAHSYADIHTVHVPMEGKPCGPATLLKEAWDRLRLPLAITECHLHSTREDQIRWFHQMWETVNKVKKEGVDFRAITAWAIFGLTGWNRLCTEPGGVYEPGVFNISSGTPKPTALARLIQDLATRQNYYHPVLEFEGWWQRKTRLQYGVQKVVSISRKRRMKNCRPLLILSKGALLGKAFEKVCEERNIHYLLLNTNYHDVSNKERMKEMIKGMNPWGIVNTADYETADKLEEIDAAGVDGNAQGTSVVAELCRDLNIRFLSYVPDPLLKTEAKDGYGHYAPDEQLRTEEEQSILQVNDCALVVRTSNLFSPWNADDFISSVLSALRDDQQVKAAADVFMVPTYVPDLVHISLDLLLDEESGIVHMTNGEMLSQLQLSKQLAMMVGYDANLVKEQHSRKVGWKENHRIYKDSLNKNGICMPGLQSALERYFEAQENLYGSGRMAV